MILRQKIAMAIVGIAFLLCAGYVETKPLVSLAMLGVMIAAILGGGLVSKKTSYEAILKEHQR